MLNKLKNNKPLKIIGNIIYAIALILVILILILVLIQRISNNDVALGGIRIYSVVTGSMIPKYEIGDILVSMEVEPEEIKIGDDITYSSEEGASNGKLITHSVVNIREEDGIYKFTTRGIANNADDPEISEDQVYGKVIYKPVILSFINKIIKNVYAFYFLIIVPMAIIIAKLMVNFILRREEEKEEEENTKLSEDKKGIEEEKNETEKDINLNNGTEENIKKKEVLESKDAIDNETNQEKKEEVKEEVAVKDEENAEKENLDNEKKKTSIIKLILKKVKLSHIIILICLLIFNTFAWFMYATEVSTSMTAHVTSWNIEFAAGEGEIVTNIEIDLDRIFPGMETYEQNISVYNKGESKATLDYEFQSIEILGEKFEVGEDFTSEDLENKIKNAYPFKINIVKDDSNLVGENGEGYFRITVEWPFESGDDALDTYWGNKAYEYYSLNPGKESLHIEMMLIAVQG